MQNVLQPKAGGAVEGVVKCWARRRRDAPVEESTMAAAAGFAVSIGRGSVFFFLVAVRGTRAAGVYDYGGRVGERAGGWVGGCVGGIGDIRSVVAVRSRCNSRRRVATAYVFHADRSPV